MSYTQGPRHCNVIELNRIEAVMKLMISLTNSLSGGVYNKNAYPHLLLLLCVFFITIIWKYKLFELLWLVLKLWYKSYFRSNLDGDPRFTAGVFRRFFFLKDKEYEKKNVKKLRWNIALCWNKKNIYILIRRSDFNAFTPLEKRALCWIPTENYSHANPKATYYSY